MRSLILILIIGNLFAGTGAQGEEGLTLEKAISIAMKKNPEILSAQKKVEVSAGQRLQTEALSDPEIVFSNEGLSLGKEEKDRGEREISLGIQQDFEFPGKRSLRSKIGRYREEISHIELERVKMIIKAKVKRAYYKAILTQKTISALESNLDLLENFIDMASIRYQGGLVPYLDVLRAQVEKARLQNQLIEAKKEWQVDKASLNFLLGRMPTEALDLLTDFSFAPFEKDLLKIKEEAKRSRPSLNIASLWVEQSAVNFQLSKLSYYPDFSFGLFFPSLRTGAWGVAVGLSVPLYWWKKQKGQILEAEATRDLSHISSEATERRLMTEIENAYTGVKAAEEQVKVFEQKLLREVDDQLKIALNNYQYGKIDSLNILDIYRTNITTNLEYLKSLYLYHISLTDLEVAGEEEGMPRGMP